jgi:hypothetical protein
MKRHRPFPFVALVLLLASAAPVLHATTVMAPPFERLVGSADYIVRATVKSITSDWRENPAKPGERYIGSRVELTVLEVIKGTPPSPLILDLVGGRVGDNELTVDGAPRFAVGQESILFVKDNGRRIIPLVGMMHGRYLVRRDKRTNQDEVLRNSGQPLYSEQEVNLPEDAASPAAARGRQARPLNSAEFAQRIRQRLQADTP